MKKITFIPAVLLLMIGCSKDSNVTAPEELEQNQNSAPNAFNLISPAPGEQTDVLDIIFEWEATEDNDGDPVTYDLYVSRGNDTSPAQVARDLTETSYVLQDRSPYNTSFNWYVVAKDGKTSGETTSGERTFTTRNLQLRQVLSNESPRSFSRRFSYTGMYFNDNFYLVNGYGGSGDLGDVWSSESYGQDWSQSADMSGTRFERYGHSSVIFNNRMYVIGGYRNSQPITDVYVSSDGSNWSQYDATRPFDARYEHTTLVFRNKIWIIGGYNDTTFLDDVMSWSGSTQDPWEPEVEGPRTPFNGIRGHSSVVFDNKMWIIGGIDRADGHVGRVWVSDNGLDWTAGRTFPENIAYHKSVVFDNKIWVIGGQTPSGSSNQIYYYDLDTNTWNEYDLVENIIDPLYSHSIVAVNHGGADDGIYIFGSFDGSAYFTGVWKLY